MASTLPSSVDLSETMQPNLYASSTIPYVIALTCVVLRFWCRWFNKAGFWLDDWLILIALVCGWHELLTVENRLMETNLRHLQLVYLLTSCGV